MSPDIALIFHTYILYLYIQTLKKKCDSALFISDSKMNEQNWKKLLYINWICQCDWTEFVLKWKIKFSLGIALQTIICNYFLLIGSVCTSVGVSNNTEFVMVCLTCMMALKCELGTGTICDRDTAIETILNVFWKTFKTLL